MVSIKIKSVENKVKSGKIIVTAQELEFGVNVFKFDSIQAKAKSDSCRSILCKEDLEDVKRGMPSDLKIVIDRNEPWCNVFTMPSWEEETRIYTKMVHQAINEFGTSK